MRSRKLEINLWDLGPPWTPRAMYAAAVLGLIVVSVPVAAVPRPRPPRRTR